MKPWGLSAEAGGEGLGTERFELYKRQEWNQLRELCVMPMEEHLLRRTGYKFVSKATLRSTMG